MVVRPGKKCGLLTRRRTSVRRSKLTHVMTTAETSLKVRVIANLFVETRMLHIHICSVHVYGFDTTDRYNSLGKIMIDT